MKDLTERKRRLAIMLCNLIFADEKDGDDIAEMERETREYERECDEEEFKEMLTAEMKRKYAEKRIGGKTPYVTEI